jgi:hypothetical protein
MRSILCLLLFGFPLAIHSQQAELPTVLIPGELARATALSMGYCAVKLLPRGTYPQPDNSYSDSDNPLGVRLGGAFYSFTNRSHSYNKTPQITLDDGVFAVGFYGMSYGFIHDLGEFPLTNITLDLSAAAALNRYTPPRLKHEIRAAQRSSHQYEINGIKFVRNAPARAGHSYLLRAISDGEADILVAFSVVSVNPDRSIELIWKELKTFDIPIALRMPDAEMREKAAAVLSKRGITGVQFSVTDNEITLIGTVSRENFADLIRAIAEIGPRKLVNQLVLIEN